MDGNCPNCKAVEEKPSVPPEHTLPCNACFFISQARINVRPETIKLFEENIGRTLDDTNQSKILYDLPPRVMEKEK